MRQFKFSLPIEESSTLKSYKLNIFVNGHSSEDAKEKLERQLEKLFSKISDISNETIEVSLDKRD